MTTPVSTNMTAREIITAAMQPGNTSAATASQQILSAVLTAIDCRVPVTQATMLTLLAKEQAAAATTTSAAATKETVRDRYAVLTVARLAADVADAQKMKPSVLATSTNPIGGNTATPVRNSSAHNTRAAVLTAIQAQTQAPVAFDDTGIDDDGVTPEIPASVSESVNLSVLATRCVTLITGVKTKLITSHKGIVATLQHMLGANASMAEAYPITRGSSADIDGDLLEFALAALSPARREQFRNEPSVRGRHGFAFLRLLMKLEGATLDEALCTAVEAILAFETKPSDLTTSTLCQRFLGLYRDAISAAAAAGASTDVITILWFNVINPILCAPTSIVNHLVSDFLASPKYNPHDVLCPQVLVNIVSHNQLGCVKLAWPYAPPSTPYAGESKRQQRNRDNQQRNRDKRRDNNSAADNAPTDTTTNKQKPPSAGHVFLNTITAALDAHVGDLTAEHARSYYLAAQAVANFTHVDSLADFMSDNQRKSFYHMVPKHWRERFCAALGAPYDEPTGEERRSWGRKYTGKFVYRPTTPAPPPPVQAPVQTSNAMIANAATPAVPVQEGWGSMPHFSTTDATSAQQGETKSSTEPSRAQLQLEIAALKSDNEHLTRENIAVQDDLEQAELRAEDLVTV